MKNSENESTILLTTKELKNINGGEWWTDLLSYGLGFAGAGGATVGLIIGLGISDANSGAIASPHIYIGY